MSADFGISALTVGHLRWVCWHHVRHYHDSACGGYRTPDERELCGSSPQRRIKSTQGPVVDYGRVIYVPEVGPVYTYERMLVNPGEPSSIGIGERILTLTDTGAPSR